MESEYTELAGLVAEAARELPRGDRIAAACRGSGDPGLLAWVAESLELTPGQRLVDVGGGLGGPAAWLTDRYGVTATVVDPSVASVRGAATLFDLPGTAAVGATLPFRPHSFDAGCCLAVLSTVPDPAAVLDALAAVVRPGGSVAVAAYCATGPDTVTGGGSTFRTWPVVAGLLAGAGLRVVAHHDTTFGAPPPRWQSVQSRIDEHLHGHAGESSVAAAMAAEAEVSGLVEAAVIARHVVVAATAPRPAEPG